MIDETKKERLLDLQERIMNVMEWDEELFDEYETDVLDDAKDIIESVLERND